MKHIDDTMAQQWIEALVAQGESRAAAEQRVREFRLRQDYKRTGIKPPGLHWEASMNPNPDESDAEAAATGAYAVWKAGNGPVPGPEHWPALGGLAPAVRKKPERSSPALALPARRRLRAARPSADGHPMHSFRGRVGDRLDENEIAPSSSVASGRLKKTVHKVHKKSTGGFRLLAKK